MRAYFVPEGSRFPLRTFIEGSEQITGNLRSVLRKAMSALGCGFVRAWDRMSESMERAQYAQRDAFFDQAVDLRDLEHRFAHYEHTGLPHY